MRGKTAKQINLGPIGAIIELSYMDTQGIRGESKTVVDDN